MGGGMSSGWRSLGCQDASCMVSSSSARETKAVQTALQRHCESKHSVVSCQAERSWGTCCKQTRMERLNPQSCYQLRRSMMPEALWCERKVTQGCFSNDNNNGLPMPPLVKTLCLQAKTAEPPSHASMRCIMQMSSLDPMDNHYAEDRKSVV